MRARRFDYVAGIGGIGSGILYRFQENKSLGRNESRMAVLTDVRDYCKLHIILHYVSVLGPDIPMYAIGKVGDDIPGREVVQMMRDAGICVDYVGKMEDAHTMFSVCFTYPDSDGGNITSCNSATQYVSKKDVDEFFRKEAEGRHGLLLAAPEAPLEVREYFLKRGRELNCFNTASFAPSEVEACIAEGMLCNVDYLSINKEEMEAFHRVLGISRKAGSFECCKMLRKYNPDIQIVVTLGKEGAYAFANGQFVKTPAIWKQAVNSAGAGDCYMGTVIAAFLRGLPLLGNTGSVGICGLAALAASMKVECKDTISTRITRQTLLEKADELNIRFSPQIYKNFFQTDRT